MELDICYIIGLLIIWFGNVKQILKTIKTKSTKSIELWWIFAILASFVIRLPRAVTSDYWVWKGGYIISILICIVLVSVIVYFRRRYPGR